MTSANNLRTIADRARAIPGAMGLREYTVTLVWATWSGEQPGDGVPETRETPLLVGGQSPKVRWLTDREVAIASVPAGTIEVGPLTPAFGTGGTDRSLLVGADSANGETRYLFIRGPRLPNGARYRISSILDKPLGVTLRADPAG